MADPVNAKASRPERLSRAELSSRIEPFLLERLPEEGSEIEWLDPRSLLSGMRLDLGVKLLYARDLLCGESHHADLYQEHIRLFSLGTFEEPGNPLKVGPDKFHDEFLRILSGIRQYGFDATQSVVPLANDGTLLNGGHRVAASIALAVDQVPCVRTTAAPGDYGQAFFSARGGSDVMLDLAALAMIEHDPSIFAAILWPTASHQEDQVRACLGQVIYERRLDLSYAAGRTLLAQVYRGEAWLGAAKDGYPGTQSKADDCRLGAGPIRLILFRAKNTADATERKEAVRQLFRVGKHSIHINDTPEQALEIGNLLLNANARHFLENADLARAATAMALAKDFSEKAGGLGYAADRYVFDGSIVLGVYGLREPRDIDFQAVDSAAGLVVDGQGNHAEELSFHGCNASRLVTDKRMHFEIQGMRFVSLAQMMKMKQRRAEPKDLADCELMQPLLGNRPVRAVILNLQRRVRFFVARNEGLVDVLRRSAIFPLLKRTYRAFLGNGR